MSWTTALCLEENQRLWLLTPQEAGAFRYDYAAFFKAKKTLEINVLQVHPEPDDDIDWQDGEAGAELL